MHVPLQYCWQHHITSSHTAEQQQLASSACLVLFSLCHMHAASKVLLSAGAACWQAPVASHSIQHPSVHLPCLTTFTPALPYYLAQSAAVQPHALDAMPLPALLQRRAGAKGFGLFALEDLKAGQFIIEYVGGWQGAGPLQQHGGDQRCCCSRLWTHDQGTAVLAMAWPQHQALIAVTSSAAEHVMGPRAAACDGFCTARGASCRVLPCTGGNQHHCWLCMSTLPGRMRLCTMQS
jgi:hypothetical protein